jgi:tRNA (guanine37-N1)-methyltransferase
VKFHIVTIFPEFFRGPLDYGVVQKACAAGLIEIQVHDLRTWTVDRHRTVDDRPFGGGEGMLLKPAPIFEAVESIWPGRAVAGEERRVVLLSAQGARFDQAKAREYSKLDELLLICGRYEGVDERVAEYLADDEISIGDYVLSGGELAAAVVVDAVARLREGVLGNRTSIVDESFSDRPGKVSGIDTKGDQREPGKLLDWPQYTRPAEFRGWKVPDILMGGNHEEIAKWRRRAAHEKTVRNRPDLIKSGPDLLAE